MAVRIPAKVIASLRLVRLALALSPIADVLAGAALASPRTLPPMAALASTAGISLLLYLGGMTLNAIVDIEIDRVEAPSRPLPSGALSVATAWVLLALFWSLAIAAAAVLSTRTLIHVGAMLVLIIAYHGPCKSRNVAGPILLGSVRALNMLLGVLVAAGWPSWRVLPPVLLYGACVFGVSLVARMEDADFCLARFRAGLAVALGSLLVLASCHGPSARPLFLVLALPAAATFSLVAWLRAAPIARDQGPRPAVRRLVILLLTGFYLFDALTALGTGRLLLALVITAMLGASRLLARQFPPS
ncbi:MAG: UbiA family prenyltransferase [Planctomycetota bacterium]